MRPAIRMAVRSEATSWPSGRRGHFGLSEIPEPVGTTELCALGVQIAIAASHGRPAERGNGLARHGRGSDEPISHSDWH